MSSSPASPQFNDHTRRSFWKWAFRQQMMPASAGWMNGVRLGLKHLILIWVTLLSTIGIGFSSIGEMGATSCSVCIPNISIGNGSSPIPQLPHDHHTQQPAPDPSVAIRYQLVRTASNALSENSSDQ